MSIQGRNVQIGKCGDAVTLKASINGKAVYNVFCGVEGAEAWVADNATQLDTIAQEVTENSVLIPVYELDESDVMSDTELNRLRVA